MKTLRTMSNLMALALVSAPALCAITVQGAEKREPGVASGRVIEMLGGNLSQTEVVRGLKEALGKGVEKAIADLSRKGGFLQNSQVKIVLPDKLASVEKTLRALNQGPLVDEFVTNMNHAAELAVAEVGPIFGDAIRNMTLEDAKSLLNGPDDAATQYFRKISEQRLQEKMLPIVKQATESAGATASYKAILEKARFGTAFFKTKSPLDLDQYINQKATDGLFKMIAAEEKRIRENPAGQASDLLKKVFGNVQAKNTP